MATNPTCTSRERSSKPASGHQSQASRQPSIQSDPRGGDLYRRITNQIITAIETGTGPWRMPWHHNGAATSRPSNAITGHNYWGINTLALWAAAETAGYAQGLWAT